MFSRVKWALLASFTLASSAFGQGSAPLGLEWGMPRAEATARISMQAKAKTEKIENADLYENARLGEFAQCDVALRFVDEELASVTIIALRTGPHFFEQVVRFADVLCRAFGNPLKREIDFKSFDYGIEMPWTVKNDAGRPVAVQLNANHNGLQIVFRDVERAGGLEDRPRLSLHNWLDDTLRVRLKSLGRL